MAVSLCYEEYGSGEPIFLIHGLALDHTIWYPLRGKLPKGLRVIMPDVRSHGCSPSPPGPYTMAGMAEDVVKIMDLLKIESAYFAGHSMGGYISLSIAKNFPDRMKGLALVASHIYADADEKKQSRLEMVEKLFHEQPVDVLEEMLTNLTKNKEIATVCKQLIANTNAQGMQAVLEAMANRPSYEDVWDSLDKSALIIAGKEDQLIPIETSRTMAEKLTHSQIVEVEHAGHVPMLEEPQVTAESLIDFVLKD